MDITDVQKFLGHEDIAATRLHGESSLAMLRRKSDQVAHQTSRGLVRRISEERGAVVDAFAANLPAEPRRGAI